MSGAAALLGLAAAVSQAVGLVLSKRLTYQLPARQLIGPLLALNALLVVPLALVTGWRVTAAIAALHVAEVGLLVATSLATWDLFAHGEASATGTAQSLSPLPAALAVALWLPGAYSWTQAVVAAIVVVCVGSALVDSFGPLGRSRTAATVLLTAVGAGVLTVTSRLLADLGATIGQTYLVRTTIAAAVMLAFVPPTDLRLRDLPRLAVRAAFVTTHFLLILLAVRVGSPAVVQTVVATAPLFVLAYESAGRSRLPSRRVLLGALGAAAGVAAIFVI